MDKVIPILWSLSFWGFLAVKVAGTSFAASAVIGIPLALVAFSLALALWLIVLGYFIAGWPGAFVGGCTMLILNAVKGRSADESRTRRSMPDDRPKPGFPL